MDVESHAMYVPPAGQRTAHSASGKPYHPGQAGRRLGDDSMDVMRYASAQEQQGLGFPEYSQAHVSVIVLRNDAL